MLLSCYWHDEHNETTDPTGTARPPPHPGAPLTPAASPLQIANDISEAEREEPDQEYNVANWDFVSPTAVVEEYMENMYQCVSAI